MVLKAGDTSIGLTLMRTGLREEFQVINAVQMIKVLPFFNPWWKNSFRLRLSVDAKAIREEGEWRTVCLNVTRIHFTMPILITAGETQLWEYRLSYATLTQWIEPVIVDIRHYPSLLVWCDPVKSSCPMLSLNLIKPLDLTSVYRAQGK